VTNEVAAPGTAGRRSLVVYLVSLAAFLGPFTQTVYAPILPELRTRFGTSQLVVNLTISVFTAVLAVMQIVYGPLTDRRGRRAVLLPGLAVYVVASVACAFAPTAGALLAARAVQAAGIAAGSVVATTVIGDLFTGAERGRAMGTFQMMVALGPVVGPVVGGVVATHAGYVGVFLTLAAGALAVLAAQAALMPETRPAHLEPSRRMAVRDFATVLADPRGGAISLLGLVQFYGYYCFLVFLPEILRVRYGLGAGRTGLALLPVSLGVVTGSFVGGRVQERWPPGRVLVATSLLNAGALAAFVGLSAAGLRSLIVGCAAFGLLLGLSLPVQTSLLAGAFVRERATAIGVYNFARYLGMAAGPLLGTLLYRAGGVPFLYGFAAAIFAAAALFAGRRLGAGTAPA
jgi:MFS transporter, DHA1 family, multidrug resistance protein